MKTDIKRITLSDYEIVFDNDCVFLSQFLSDKNYSSVLILTDDNTKIHCYPRLLELVPQLKSATLMVVPEGEQHKTIATCEEIWLQMLNAVADRKAVVINLGGGVIGDMGGFAAACYKRGVDFIQVPTTILSQVDSSIGGKLGVDFKYGKNLVGVFKNPVLVAISAEWMKTLSHRQQVNGFAEIFKHALIDDAAQWEELKAMQEIPPINLSEVLYKSLMVKKHVVEEDPFEKGLRKILNFGHTIGHAVEAYSIANDENPLLHGEAIAAGMIMEAYIGHLNNSLSKEKLDEIVKVLLQHYGHYTLPNNELESVWPVMLMDKKNQGAKVLAVVLNDIAQPVIDVEITQELFLKAIQYYRSLA